MEKFLISHTEHVEHKMYRMCACLYQCWTWSSFCTISRLSYSFVTLHFGLVFCFIIFFIWTLGKNNWNISSRLRKKIHVCSVISAVNPLFSCIEYLFYWCYVASEFRYCGSGVQRLRSNITAVSFLKIISQVFFPHELPALL